MVLFESEYEIEMTYSYIGGKIKLNDVSNY